MIFDQFCGIAERHLPQLIPLLRQARLFQFPGRPHEVLPRDVTDEEVEAMRQMFFLPYPVCAIEDPASCIILEDTEPNQIGLGGLRRFIECMPFSDNPEDFQDPLEVQKTWASQMKSVNKLIPSGACAITTGRIRLDKITKDENGYSIAHYAGYVDTVCLAGKLEGLMLPPTNPDNDSAFDRVGITNAKTALEEVAYFNRPDRFVIEKSVVGSKPRSDKKIPRSDSRPLYTALTVTEIRDSLIQSAPSSGGGGKKAPHERRRHFRTFKSERYKSMKGKTIVVPASWIGPSEVTKGRHHYKICLDI
jgi:hypothetical protein